MRIDLPYTPGCWATAVACLRLSAPSERNTWFGQSGHGGPAELVMHWEEAVDGLFLKRSLTVRFV